MRALKRSALFLLLLVLAAPPAFANTPSPMTWSIPSHVTLVGIGPAGPDSAIGHVTCVIRDLANNPVPGSVVTFDFSLCTGLSIATDQHDPRLAVNCGARTVSAMTDENGIARFTVLGAGTAGPAHPPRSCHIYADGVLGGNTSVAVLERDGVGGLTLADLSLWTADYFASTNAERSDLNGSGSVNLADLSVWATAYFSGNNAQPLGALCP